MCSPAAMLGIQAVGTATSAMGAINEGKSKQAYYSFLASQNRIQEPQILKAANLNTGEVSGAAAREETNLNRNVASVEGSQKATAAASGVWSGSGTTSDILRDTESKAALDRSAIRQNANLRTRAIALDASGRVSAMEGQAQSFDMAGEDALSAGKQKAAASILSGAGQVASNWYRYMQTKKTAPKADPLSTLYGDNPA